MTKLVTWHRTLYVVSTLCFGLAILHFMMTPAGEVRAQAEPVIQHSAIECFPNNRHAICSAVITPGAEVQNARVYFRSDKHPDFYYVDMPGDGDNFEAVLPIPSEETDRVIYYVEAVNHIYNVTRTGDNDSQVTSESECERRDAGALWWTGGNPGIVVGATVEGAAAIPPGFQAAGISGFLSAAGGMSSTGGGIGTGAAIGIGAGAAAAVGAGVALSGGDSSTTTVVSGGGPSTTTSIAASTTTTAATSGNEAPRACLTIEPANGEITVGNSVRLDARCSEGDKGGGGDPISKYEWDLGDGRMRSGPDLNFISPRYNTAGVFTITLTVTDSGGASSSVFSGIAQSGQPLQDSVSQDITVTEPPVRACFKVSTATPGSWPVCDMTFNAKCSEGTIIDYSWVLDVGGVISRVTKNGEVVSHTWGFSCSGGETILVSLTVTGEGGQKDVVSQNVKTVYLTSPFLDEKTVATSFSSYLGVPPFDGSVRGQIMVNGVRAFQTDSSNPFVSHVQGKLGENVVEAFTMTPTQEPGFWRFDFSGAAGFVAGSLKVQSGQVTSMDSRSVVFRLSGAPGERIKFTYQLLP